MSASLVGSEMCIRDRYIGAPLGDEACAPRLLAGAPLHPGLPHQQGPVSYTHLTLPTICSV
eukprot:8040623-Alexandrium_andersonii.AAC.1